MTNSPASRIFDGFNRHTGQKTEVVGIRVFASQKQRLNEEFDGNASALVRILLDKYFSGSLPDVEKEFQHFIKTI
jgi:hypothetical protein